MLSFLLILWAPSRQDCISSLLDEFTNLLSLHSASSCLVQCTLIREQLLASICRQLTWPYLEEAHIPFEQEKSFVGKYETVICQMLLVFQFSELVFHSSEHQDSFIKYMSVFELQPIFKSLDNIIYCSLEKKHFFCIAVWCSWLTIKHHPMFKIKLLQFICFSSYVFFSN